jgi:hypothetical protein
MARFARATVPSSEDRPAAVANHSGVWCVLALAWIAVVVAVRYAEPISDGDLFIHLRYAEQMLERGTLRIDHTLYSWTPTTNDTIYCVWVGELLLWFLREHAGMWSLFALRYAVVVSVLALLWTYARRAGVAKRPLTYVVLLVVAVASRAGTLIKPDLFSFFLLQLLVGVYFRAKLAALRGDDPRPWLYAAPVIVLLWVNTHGGFILAAPVLLAAALGELINVRAAPRVALGARGVRHLLISWGLCGVAVMLTPYGPRYPAQLINYFALRTTRPGEAWNTAYQSIFAFGAAAHFVPLLAIMAGTVLVLLAAADGKRRWRWPADWAVLLTNLACVPLFVVYVRSTYVWPAVFGYSALYLAAARRGRARLGHPLLAYAAAGLIIGLGGRAMHDAWRRPTSGSWLGFGISYVNPVMEAEYLAQQHLGPRLYNIFDSGSYLLWRLYPQYEVMTDSRFFPYVAWFDEQYRFTNGDSFADFLAKYPGGDVAVIDLAKTRCVQNFLASTDWRLTFYGPTAAVFVKASVPVATALGDASPERFAHLRNGPTALRVFDFAVKVGDYPTAWLVLDQLETSLAAQTPASMVAARRAYRNAHAALRAHDYAAARTLFAASLETREPSDRDWVIQHFLDNLAGTTAATADPAASAIDRAALDRLAAADAEVRSTPATASGRGGT